MRGRENVNWRNVSKFSEIDEINAYDTNYATLHQTVIIRQYLFPCQL